MIPAAESLLQRIDRKEQRIAIDALHSDGSLLKGEGGGGGGGGVDGESDGGGDIGVFKVV